MKLHREGKFLIPLCVILTSAILGGLWFPLQNSPWLYVWIFLALLGAVFVFLIFNFFRNPVFFISRNESLVLAPCDGKVVVIEETEDSIHLKRKVIQVSIFMSPLNVHVNRNPISGKVAFLRYFPGKYLMAFHPKSSSDNEHTYIVIDNGKSQVAFKQIAGFLARRIKWYITENQAVTQGDEMGFIRFGSRVDILLPFGSRVQVKLGQKIFGGRTVIAELPGG